MSSKDFGQQLRTWRLAAGFGLRRFAKLIGELPSNLSAVETGGRQPWRSMEKLRTIAQALAIQEGSLEWDRFFLAARKTDTLPPDIDRLLDRELNLALLRTVEEKQFSDKELQSLVEYVRKKKVKNAKPRDNRRLD